MKLFTGTLIVFLAVLLSSVNGYGQTYKVVDTGQDKCYNNSLEISAPQEGEAFYGQDAQLDGYQPSYTLSSDSLTVLDNVTGLTWIRTPDTDDDGNLDTYDKLTWPEFQSYSDILNAESFGGYDDWRLPTIKELYSLMDFRGTDPMSDDPTGLIPFIDTDYFDFVYGDTSVERIIDAQYWSSTEYMGTTMGGDSTVFGVNFADGRIKGYPRDNGPGGVQTQYARYVRGNTDYGINDLIDNGDGTITDNATGLMWSQHDRGDGVSNGPRSGMIWEEALAWVQQKNDENYLGHNDWRLPNAKEMQSIVDYSRSPEATGSAAIDPVFNITEITNERGGEVDYPWFWTGTTHARQDGAGEAGAYVCFGRGMGYMFGSWIDAHGAGCQRSDRKDGDFSGYTYVPYGYYFGMAPQGDAARMYNYVRLVRDESPTLYHIDDPMNNIPESIELGQNNPNPFNPQTAINYRISYPDKVILRIYDLRGREIKTLVDDFQAAGNHQVFWDGTDNNGTRVGSGIYFYNLQIGNNVETRKMVLTK
jgi:hypothetical protein